MFLTAALFVIAKYWKLPECLSVLNITGYYTTGKKKKGFLQTLGNIKLKKNLIARVCTIYYLLCKKIQENT